MLPSTRPPAPGAPPLSFGYSPCPNDTFAFHALVHGRVPTAGVRLEPQLEDVETLNRWARRAALDVTKASYGAIPFLFDHYVLLRSGGALGRGCGPLLVARKGYRAERLSHARIAIPGRFTTANLLLRLWRRDLAEGTPMRYSEILPAVAAGTADAGLIIHESRFTYAQHGLVALQDLGQWWEEATGLPIPLGGILARRTLSSHTRGVVERALRDSVRFAWQHPAASAEYVRRHAQELAPDVIGRHIELYVNSFSAELGEPGERAVRELLRRASAAGLAPATPDPFG